MSLWAGADLRLADEIHDAAFIDHASDARGTDLTSFKSGISNLYAAFPDFCAKTQHLVVDEIRATVAIMWTANGHHRFPFMGRPASLARIDFKGIEIIRIAHGKIVERWGEWDGLHICAQMDRALGVQP